MSALVATPDRRPSLARTGHAAASYKAILHTSLESAADTWRDLERTGACTAYQRLEWVTGIVDRIMPGQKSKPLIVEITDRKSSRCAALLPFALIRRRTHSEITWLDLGVCDYAAPLLGPDFVPTVRNAQEVWAAARAVLPRVDLVRVTQISERLGGTPNPLALLPFARPMQLQSYGLPIEGPPDTLLKRLCGASVDKKFRRSGRRLAEHGEVKLIVAESQAEAASLFDILLDQRRQRFRDLGRFDLLNEAHIRDFYRDAVQDGLRGGPARLFGVSVGGTIIATALGLVHGGTFHGILLAMDSAWMKAGPGLYIALDLMIWARRQGLDYFDFTVGDLPYKADLGARPNTLFEIAQPQTLLGTVVLAGAQSLVHGKAYLKSHPRVFQAVRSLRGGARRLASRNPRTLQA